MANKYKIAVFISGGGSNFRAIHQAILQDKMNAKISCVISSTEKAGGLQYARDNNLPCYVPAREILGDASRFTDFLLEKMTAGNVSLVVLAGFLKKIPAAFIESFSGHIINIHPALLPSFGGKGMYGRHVHQAVIDYGCKISGATVHLVSNDYDAGPPIFQKCVPVFTDDSAESLAARVLEIEHEILPQAIASFANNQILITGRKIEIR